MKHFTFFLLLFFLTHSLHFLKSYYSFILFLTTLPYYFFLLFLTLAYSFLLFFLTLPYTFLLFLTILPLTIQENNLDFLFMFSGKRVEIPRRTSNLTEIDFEFVVIYVDRMSALYLSRCVNVEKKIFSFNILVISSCPTVDHYRLSVSSLVFFDDVYILFVFGIHFTG